MSSGIVIWAFVIRLSVFCRPTLHFGHDFIAFSHPHIWRLSRQFPMSQNLGSALYPTPDRNGKVYGYLNLYSSYHKPNSFLPCGKSQEQSCE